MALGKIEIIPSAANTNTAGPGSSGGDAVASTSKFLASGPASDTSLSTHNATKSKKKKSKKVSYKARTYERSDLVNDYYDRMQAAEQNKPAAYRKSAQVNDYYNRLQTAEADKPGDYTQGAEVTNYQNKVKALEANKPNEFKSRYETQIQDILSGILNEKDFSYTGKDMMSDDLYKLYRDQYTREGNLAMRDAAGNAASLTGGYGSTYSQAAGQQAYDSYLSKLNDRALDFRDRAYQQYQDAQANRYRQLSAVQGLDDTDYGRYRDTVGDYYNDLNYMNNRYQQEYEKDYGRYRDKVGDYYTDLNYLADRYDSEYAKDYGEHQNMVAQDQFAANLGMQQDQYEENMAYQREQDAAEAARWAKEYALKQRDADLDYNIKTLQYQKALEGASGGSGGSGGGGGGRGGSRRRSGGGSSSSSPSADVTNKYNGSITVEDAKKIMTQEAALHGRASAAALGQSLLNDEAVMTLSTYRQPVSKSLSDHLASLPAANPIEKRKYAALINTVSKKK